MSNLIHCDRCGRTFRQTLTGVRFCSQACAQGLRPRHCQCDNPIPVRDEDNNVACHKCGKDLTQRPPGAAPRSNVLPPGLAGADFWKKAA